MDPTLTLQRCWTHPAREAAARCPACTRFFCRECVTEHEGRLLCAGCLRAALQARALRPGAHSVFGRLASGAQLTVGLAMAWLFFYLLGQALLATPSAFHETSLWMDSLFHSGEDEP